MYHLLHFFGVQVNIREVCVLTAPIFSAFTALSAYHFTKEVVDSSAGLLAAALIAIVPGYIQRSVAGSYDNEGVAITALLLTFFMWVKSINTGSLSVSALTTLAYLYMVSAWGGYVFIINLIPIYVLLMIVSGRYSQRLYVAYNTFYVLGTLLSMQIRFVGFQAVQSSEHLGAFLVFGFINLYALSRWLESFAGKSLYDSLKWLLAVAGLGTAFLMAIVGTVTGYIGPWAGRFYTMLDPTYASKHIPIIASVSEHQPTSWGAYFFDLHATSFLMPLGLWFCLTNLTDGRLFMVVYGTCALYFSGVMVRLMLVLAPIAAVLTGIGGSAALKSFVKYMKAVDRAPISEFGDSSNVTSLLDKKKTKEAKISTTPRKSKKGKKGTTKIMNVSTTQETEALVSKKRGTAPREIAAVMLIGFLMLLGQYVRHCIWVTSEAYSSPSVVLSARGNSGERVFFDDYREGYYWLRQNTDDDAKIMSWWDYGYQISGMANRTVIVDNNTWNNSHIATVGKAMNAPEDKAYLIARKLDVDYVLVIFGGLIGYSSDDINKFLWMVRIGNSVDPSIREADYLSNRGYTVGEDAGPALKKSLMYKLSYYRFNEMGDGRGNGASDRVRGVPITSKIKLKYFEEAFTSEHWIVRIYRVKKPDTCGWV